MLLHKKKSPYIHCKIAAHSNQLFSHFVPLPQIFLKAISFPLFCLVAALVRRAGGPERIYELYTAAHNSTARRRAPNRTRRIRPSAATYTKQTTKFSLVSVKMLARLHKA